MIGVNTNIGIGVVKINRSSDSSNIDISEKIVQESFVYDGVNNTFQLSASASKILDIYIDQGVYPSIVPAGETDTVTIDENLLFNGVNITIKYLKA